MKRMLSLTLLLLFTRVVSPRIYRSHSSPTGQSGVGLCRAGWPHLRHHHRRIRQGRRRRRHADSERQGRHRSLPDSMTPRESRSSRSGSTSPTRRRSCASTRPRRPRRRRSFRLRRPVPRASHLPQRRDGRSRERDDLRQRFGKGTARTARCIASRAATRRERGGEGSGAGVGRHRPEEAPGVEHAQRPDE
jgi:hypothetical protein